MFECLLAPAVCVKRNNTSNHWHSEKPTSCKMAWTLFTLSVPSTLLASTKMWTHPFFQVPASKFKWPTYESFQIELSRESWSERKRRSLGRGRGKEEQKFSSSLAPSPFIPLFCSRPNFLDELARKRLLRRQEFRHEYKSRHCTLALNWALGPREPTFSVSFATTHCLAYLKLLRYVPK